mgnify:FL=1
MYLKIVPFFSSNLGLYTTGESGSDGRVVNVKSFGWLKIGENRKFCLCP